MSESFWVLLPCGLFAAAVVFILAIGGAAAGTVIWVLSSNSTRAARARKRFGIRGRHERMIPARIFWGDEARRLESEALRQFAGKRSFSHRADDQSLFPELKGFSRALKSYSSATSNEVVYWENAGRTFCLALYDYDDGEGSGMNTILYTDVGDLGLPAFYLTSETVMHKLLFGRRDIDFEEDPDFSSLCHLEAQDESAIRDLFDGEVRSAFVAAARCTVECAFSRLLFIDSIGHTDLSSLEEFVDESLHLLHLIGSRWSTLRPIGR